MTLNDRQSNILISQSIEGGGITSQINATTNLERRNRGLSLLNQTTAHCISPSSYDTTTSLNDINLQLHASSTVSNPYTFSISSNTSFSASIAPALPTKDTILNALKVDYHNDNEVRIVVIPEGVNVIKVYSYCYNDNDERTYYSLEHGTYPNNKYWGSADINTTKIRYVGVTPGKSYTVTAEVSSDSSTGFSGGSRIYYSAEINTHTPDVPDY